MRVAFSFSGLMVQTSLTQGTYFSMIGREGYIYESTSSGGFHLPLPPCGRTAQNSTLTEALVFHQTLSTPKASYSGRCPSGTPQGRTQKIHIFPNDPIMRMSYNTYPFHTSEFLKITLLQYQMSEYEMINTEI